jgi:XrtN system VIT domain protein
MKTIKENILRNTTLLVGVGLTIFSLIIFLIPDFLHQNKTDGGYFGVFMLNYFISVIYFIVIWVRESKEFRFKLIFSKIEYGFIHLNLCLISAFSLNREIPVFERSVNWLQILLVIQGFVLFMSFIKDGFPKIILFFYWTCLGIIFSLFFYFTCFLIPLFGIGVALSFVLGISLHALIPLFFVVTLVLYLFRRDNLSKLSISGFTMGLFISLTFAGYNVYQWGKINNVIQKAMDHALMDSGNDLPEWVSIAENLPKNNLTEKVLKTGLVYSMAPEAGNLDFFKIPQRSFDETGKHDPFVMLSTFIYGQPNITSENKIKILETMYDSRHKTQERLWNGDDLETRHVVSNIRLYPSLRIAYTEKIITIKNERPINRRSPLNEFNSNSEAQEAIYTFHLPEGSVVTSLSLWIKGKECPGILSDKNKADSAYRTIVGVEQHDPSLVRWQEGNTVTVRVFPCSPDEDRMFKIGITTPLELDGNTLKYKDIFFDGPVTSNADESAKIYLMEHLDNIKISEDFEKETIDSWLYSGIYNSDLNIEFPVCKISENHFAFDGNTYSIKEYKKEYEKFIPENIYLDLNQNWTTNEFEQIRQLFKNYNVYVYYNKLVRLNDGNSNELFKALVKTNYTIFPVYKINDPEKSLFITKGGQNTPNVRDLGVCDFALNLKSYLLNNPKLRVFSLDNQLSPYLKTLKETRSFIYDGGSLMELDNLFKKQEFVKQTESSEQVVVNSAGIEIVKSKGSINSNAPDHIMRLFAYNHIMSRIGTNYFNENFTDTSLVKEAHQAYVVSPLTNLIVLESQQDYKRFDIKDDGASLKNASMKSSGAVPEPHEWALIIIIILFSGYLVKKKKQAVKTKTA